MNLVDIVSLFADKEIEHRLSINELGQSAIEFGQSGNEFGQSANKLVKGQMTWVKSRLWKST